MFILRLDALRVRIFILFAHEQAAGKDYENTDGDSRIGDVENEEGAERADVEIGIVDDIAQFPAIADVTQRPAKDQRQPENVAQQLFAHHPYQHHQCDRGGDEYPLVR